jgi:hypothetical protein
VGIELRLKIVSLELRVTPFADGDGRRGWLYDSQFALHGFNQSGIRLDPLCIAIS